MDDSNRNQMIGFSERLTKAVYDSGKSKKVIASKIKISKNSLNNYMNGYQIPNSTVLAKLGKELGVSVDWLLYG